MVIQKTAHILIIDSTDNTPLQASLKQHGFEVNYLSSEQATIEAVQHANPDLIILNVEAAAALLSSFTRHKLAMPVVLIGADGETTSADLSYPHIVGWLNHVFTVSELALLIQTALTQPLPAGELVLARRADLIETNRQLTSRVQELQTLFEIGKLVSSTLDVQQIPRLLLRRTAEIVEAECGSLSLIDHERGGVVFQLAYDDQGQEVKGLENFLMPPGTGIVGLVAQTGEPVIANEVKKHPAWSPLPDQITGFTTRKLIAVPLIVEGEILGVMELLNKKTGDFTPEDAQLLSLVASAAASAIQNARQYEALKRTNQALQEAQEQRIAAERWAVLGKAAASLAHRINNTTALAPMAAEQVAELLKRVEIPPEIKEKIERNLDRIKRNSLYTVELAAVLLRRFRKNPTQAHDVNELVEKALGLVEIPPNIRVVRHLDPELPPADTSDLLVDAFVELLSNAVRLMAHRDGLLHIATFKNTNDTVSIQITDNGPGILEENIERVFEMFYTTNPSGLGFGLWWVKTFLEQQRGEIVVESRPDEHTTFTITLPRHWAHANRTEL
jgi:signal transduction histidine kinase